jgi:hypothetical protein
MKKQKKGSLLASSQAAAEESREKSCLRLKGIPGNITEEARVRGAIHERRGVCNTPCRRFAVFLAPSFR